MERASRKYSYEKRKTMMFLGTNIDAVKEAARFGIDTDRAAIMQVRCCAAPLSADWKRKVDADYKKRGK